MDPFQQSQTFFFISSIGFIFLWILVMVFLFYLIYAADTFLRILKKIEKDIDNVGDTTKEMIEEVKDSRLFGFFLRKKKKAKTHK